MTRPRLIAVVGFGWLGAAHAALAAESNAAASVRLGILNYTQTDGKTPKAGVSSVRVFEYGSYLRLDRELILGYRQADDATTKRNNYQSAYGGLRYFPLGIGRPSEATVLDKQVYFDSHLRWYVEPTLAFGRAAYSFLLGGTSEQSADVAGIGFGTGLVFYPLNHILLDVSGTFETYQQRGGTASALSLSGTNTYLLGGAGWLF